MVKNIELGDKMEDLIEALRIFKKYVKDDWPFPFHCEHDILMIGDVEPFKVSEEDTKRLDELGFFVSSEFPDSFVSLRFGSC
jgi:hypothetical protein